MESFQPLAPTAAHESETGTSDPKKNSRKPRGRVSSVSKVLTKPVKKNKEPVKLPGDLSFDLNCYSITITKNGGDIATEYLDIMSEFLKCYCHRGAFSLEVGTRAFNLHIQGVIELRYPTTPTYAKQLAKFIKLQLPTKTGHKVSVKPFSKTQTFVAMIGYVLKDEGKPHFQIKTHNVDTNTIRDGHITHSAMRTSIDDNRKVC